MNFLKPVVLYNATSHVYAFAARANKHKANTSDHLSTTTTAIACFCLLGVLYCCMLRNHTCYHRYMQTLHACGIITGVTLHVSYNAL